MYGSRHKRSPCIARKGENGFAHRFAQNRIAMDFYPLNQKKEIIKKYLRHQSTMSHHRIRIPLPGRIRQSSRAPRPNRRQAAATASPCFRRRNRSAHAREAARKKTARGPSFFPARYRYARKWLQLAAAAAAAQAVRPGTGTGVARTADCHNLPALCQERNRCSAHAPARMTHRHARRADGWAQTGSGGHHAG